MCWHHSIRPKTCDSTESPTSYCAATCAGRISDCFCWLLLLKNSKIFMFVKRKITKTQYSINKKTIDLKHIKDAPLFLEPQKDEKLPDLATGRWINNLYLSFPFSAQKLQQILKWSGCVLPGRPRYTSQIPQLRWAAFFVGFLNDGLAKREAHTPVGLTAFEKFF